MTTTSPLGVGGLLPLNTDESTVSPRFLTLPHWEAGGAPYYKPLDVRVQAPHLTSAVVGAVGFAMVSEVEQLIPKSFLSCKVALSMIVWLERTDLSQGFFVVVWFVPTDIPRVQLLQHSCLDLTWGKKSLLSTLRESFYVSFIYNFQATSQRNKGKYSIFPEMDFAMQPLRLASLLSSRLLGSIY